MCTSHFEHLRGYSKQRNFYLHTDLSNIMFMNFSSVLNKLAYVQDAKIILYLVKPENATIKKKIVRTIFFWLEECLFKFSVVSIKILRQYHYFLRLSI